MHIGAGNPSARFHMGLPKGSNRGVDKVLLGLCQGLIKVLYISAVTRGP